MSKKSRKRNKKILAAIGIGLGAAALASRKPKQSDVSQDSGRGSGLRDTVDTAKKTVTPKKDTAVTTETTIQDNKKIRNPDSIFVKKNTNKVFKGKDGPDSAKVGNEKSPFIGDDGYLRKGKDATPMTTGPKGTARAASEISKGALPPQLRKPRVSNTFGPGNDGLSSYKSGGRVKGCGKALRGFGKAMKGKR